MDDNDQGLDHSNNQLKKQIEKVEDVREDFKENAEDCFDSCSKTKVESVCGMVGSLINPEAGEQLRKYNPRQFLYVINLLKPHRHSVKCNAKHVYISEILFLNF